MARKKKVEPIFNRNDDNALLSGVGAGVGLAFVEEFFPHAHQTIRIASGYFQLRGFELAREKINSQVQLRILVRGRNRSEGKNVQQTAIEIVEEIIKDFGQCQTPLVESVREILRFMNEGRFFIRDAYEIEPFHCKFYIFDENLLWHGSSNFTNNGLRVNAEQVSLICNQPEVEGFVKWFDETSAKGRDLLELLKTRLNDWLKLSKPFDIYLKTLFLLFKDLAGEPFLEGANSPAYFQQGVIQKSLRQIKEFGGSLIIAATGLGKTIIGSELAFRLASDDKIKQIILLAPYNVFDNWKAECKGRRVRNVEYFNIKVPFLKKSDLSYHEISRLEKELKYPADEMLIIIDEAHNYRNQLLTQYTEKKYSRVYNLLLPVIKKGAKIVLLTATAYSTSPLNMNSLLYLLPHKSKDFLGSNAPWRIDSTNEFSILPIVTTLGLPHVLKMARDRGDIDENGRVFIQLADTKRYLPKSIIWHRTIYDLPFQKELKKAFDEKCFDHSKKVSHNYCDSDSVKIRKGVSDTVFNSSMKSWLSSIDSLKISFEYNLSTEGGESSLPNKNQPNLFNNPVKAKSESIPRNGNGHSFKDGMLLSQSERRNILEPIYKKLSEQGLTDDQKFAELKMLVEERNLAEKSKVLIFVNRFSTAVFLSQELTNLFGNKINIGCTVENRKQKFTLKHKTVRAEILKNFAPKAHNFSSKKEYDLLICTDADGVGVNLQDADTLVNYDPPLGADVLFQRVGRILRMTDNPERNIHIYTFLPSIINESINGSNIHHKIYDLFERLKQRQNTSKSISILGTKILSSQTLEETTLNSESEIEDLLGESEEVNEIDVSNSPFRHISLLETKGIRERAAAIPDYISSAKIYPESVPQIFVLFKYKDNYFPVLYNILDKTITQPDAFEILNLLECPETQETAPMDFATIEAESLNAAEAWCAVTKFPKEEITKICWLYLVPSAQATPKNIFGNIKSQMK
jgi:superfamily II DNA or RNA helicase